MPVPSFPVTRFDNIQDWQKTHVALVSPLAYGIYMCAGDNYRLAHTRDALVLVVRAIKESFSALKTLGYTITPPYLRRMALLPEPLLVFIFSKLFDSKFAEIGLAGHANAARDEMDHLADGLLELVESSGVSAPALHSLYQFRNPQQPPLREGSRQIALRMRELWISLGAAVAVLTALGWLVSRNRKNRRKTG